MSPSSFLDGIKAEIRQVRVSELAAVCSVSRKTIDRILTDKASPSIKTLEEIAEALSRLRAQKASSEARPTNAN